MGKASVIKSLEYLSPDSAIKVGSKSNYFYCGTVQDFIDHIDEYSYFALKRADASLKKAKRLLKNALDMSISPSDYARSLLENETVFPIAPSANGYLEYLDNYFHQINKLSERCRRALEIKAAFKDFKYRDVLRLELSTAEPNCYVLILSGEENGGYWMTSDAKDSNLSFGRDGLDDE